MPEAGRSGYRRYRGWTLALPTLQLFADVLRIETQVAVEQFVASIRLAALVKAAYPLQVVATLSHMSEEPYRGKPSHPALN